MNKPILLTMCGLQGSGKTTKAKEFVQQYNFEYLCADDIRELHPTWNNNQVFDFLYKQMNNLLSNNRNVIIDVTSTTKQNRSLLLNNIKVECYKYIYVIDTPFEECKRRLLIRNKKIKRKVPVKVLYQYYKDFTTPTTLEGWDKVIFDSNFTNFDL